MTKLLDYATRVFVLIGGCLMIGVILVTIADVFARKFLNTGYLGLVDTTQLGVVTFTFLAMPRAFLTGAHVAVELYDHRLSDWADRALKCFALILSIGVFSVLLWYGWTQAMRVLDYGDVSQNIAIPMIWYWTPLLAGAGLSWLICLVLLVQNVVGYKREPSHV